MAALQGARNEIFALQPAPVQTSYMGFPATMGASFLPYLITDAVVAPESCRHCYSENLALMPNCYFVNDYKHAHMVRVWEYFRSSASALAALVIVGQRTKISGGLFEVRVDLPVLVQYITGRQQVQGS